MKNTTLHDRRVIVKFLTTLDRLGITSNNKNMYNYLDHKALIKYWSNRQGVIQDGEGLREFA